MSTVRDILQSKGSHAWSVEPEKTVFEALQLMAEKDIGAVLVVKDEKVVGIFSERDYARKVILKGLSSKEITVAELMTKDVLYVEPKVTVEDCMALMTSKHIRHLPVLENDKLSGIVTIGDVVNEVISRQKFTIRELEHYISGSYGA